MPIPEAQATGSNACSAQSDCSLISLSVLLYMHRCHALDNSRGARQFPQNPLTLLKKRHLQRRRTRPILHLKAESELVENASPRQVFLSLKQLVPEKRESLL